MPETTPQYTHPDQHSWVLQSVLAIQKSIGALEEGSKYVQVAIDKLDGKLEESKKDIGNLKKYIFAAGVVLAIFITVGGWLLNKAWDIEADTIKHLFAQAQATSESNQAPAASPRKP